MIGRRNGLCVFDQELHPLPCVIMTTPIDLAPLGHFPLKGKEGPDPLSQPNARPAIAPGGVEGAASPPPNPGMGA